MKILSCHIENFGSYKHLDFNFQDIGLALIEGATGSGKSTLCDAIPWILFGVTAKNGKADEVLNWQGGVTKGTIMLTDGTYQWYIERSRGNKANDLYFVAHAADERAVRGKDLLDTQRLINHRLGFDADLYLSGAYYHEFSQTAQFFTTTAKNRRAITEQLIDLSLPKKLQEKSSTELKSIKHQLSDLDLNISYTSDRLNRATKQYIYESERAKRWEADIEVQIMELSIRSKNWKKIKQLETVMVQEQLNEIPTTDARAVNAQIDDLLATIPPETQPCKECGAAKHNECRDRSLEEISRLRDLLKEAKFHDRERLALQSHIANVEAEVDIAAYKIDTLRNQTNPHIDIVDGILLEKETTSTELDKLTSEKESLQTKASDLDILSDIIAQFRSILIKNTILDLETKTNQLLDKHFDAEIKIELLITDTDKLDVSITKDGNLASFTQLSKGQRQLLKLCFGVAVMKAVANHHAINFEQVFFDEPLSGLDEDLKLKALSLFQSLAIDYDSLFFIEHSESIKAMINNRFHVQLINGNSVITEA